MEPLVRARGAFELRRARDPGERMRLWAGRKGAYGAMGRIAPDLYVCDAVVPRTQAARARAADDARSATRAGSRSPTSSTPATATCTRTSRYDRRDKDELRRVLEAGDEILKACLAAGGSLSGEHGIGLEKLGAMEWLFTRDDLAAMCRVREAWDPHCRMNPGKLIPVRACMETRT